MKKNHKSPFVMYICAGSSYSAEDLCMKNSKIWGKPTWNEKCTQRKSFPICFCSSPTFSDRNWGECFEMVLPFTKVVVRDGGDFAILQPFCTAMRLLSTMMWLGSPLIISRFWLFAQFFWDIRFCVAFVWPTLPTSFCRQRNVLVNWFFCH